MRRSRSESFSNEAKKEPTPEPILEPSVEIPTEVIENVVKDLAVDPIQNIVEQGVFDPIEDVIKIPSEIIQEQIVALPWIHEANVVRRWPGTLEIIVTEQIPAAIWGARGLLNTSGDLFVLDARHVPAELPRLDGPEGQSPRPKQK